MPVLCEDLFQRLAVSDPSELVRLIESGEIPDAPNLTFAAEALKDVATALAEPTLLKLLGHEHRLVREGAVLGAEAHVGHPQVRAKLAQMVEADSSPAIREIARDVLMQAAAETVSEMSDLFKKIGAQDAVTKKFLRALVITSRVEVEGVRDTEQRCGKVLSLHIDLGDRIVKDCRFVGIHPPTDDDRNAVFVEFLPGEDVG